MKKIIYIIMVVAATLCSCNKWLDITPEDTTTEKQLFSDAGGYHAALNGLYQTMSASSLYGENLTWGYLSALSQYYDNSSVGNTKKFSYTEQYEYSSNEVKAFGEQIWQAAYNLIANANNLLAHLDKEDLSIFPSREKGEVDMIRGEALAIRAFLHFDMLRLFAVAPSVERNAKAIPYITEYPAIFSERKTVSEVLACIESDLIESQSLLAEIDTTSVGIDWMDATGNRFTVSNSSKDYFLTGRGVRMNYVGVSALLARVYAYDGELEKAYTIAKELCDKYVTGDGLDSWYSFTGGFSDSDTEGFRPHKLIDELLVCFYNENLSVNYSTAVNKTLRDNYYALKNLSGIFSDNDDIRQKKLISSIDLDTKVSLKYYERSGNGITVGIENRLLPIMRISELYFIMAEYLAGEGRMDEAADLLNTLRIKRGCMGNPVSKESTFDEFMERLNLEVWRENVAEGQYFFHCKRLNARRISNNGVYVPMEGKYTMVIPDSEITLN
ncbi:MAG: RagB/SusD family nutrient uptake outer membrane protein [Bacteroidales bacterium]|nr:RagB/SusD family nutrient uptake outer membrane protein [Bacteroides sp.]MCM1198359.1 RagB/SusD family nutrient uptake outer membrane protein [Clostridium sp.]MCM1503215.1 RagB/SusD family nutrient uptake outer membrane protein [Bacteroidales bacterium]